MGSGTTSSSSSSERAIGQEAHRLAVVDDEARGRCQPAVEHDTLAGDLDPDDLPSQLVQRPPLPRRHGLVAAGTEQLEPVVVRRRPPHLGHDGAGQQLRSPQAHRRHGGGRGIDLDSDRAGLQAQGVRVAPAGSARPPGDDGVPSMVARAAPPGPRRPDVAGGRPRPVSPGEEAHVEVRLGAGRQGGPAARHGHHRRRLPVARPAAPAGRAGRRAHRPAAPTRPAATRGR